MQNSSACVIVFLSCQTILRFLNWLKATKSLSLPALSVYLSNLLHILSVCSYQYIYPCNSYSFSLHITFSLKSPSSSMLSISSDHSPLRSSTILVLTVQVFVSDHVLRWCSRLVYIIHQIIYLKAYLLYKSFPSWTSTTPQIIFANFEIPC